MRYQTHESEALFRLAVFFHLFAQEAVDFDHLQHRFCLEIANGEASQFHGATLDQHCLMGEAAFGTHKNDLLEGFADQQGLWIPMLSIVRY